MKRKSFLAYSRTYYQECVEHDVIFSLEFDEVFIEFDRRVLSPSNFNGFWNIPTMSRYGPWTVENTYDQYT